MIKTLQMLNTSRILLLVLIILGGIVFTLSVNAKDGVTTPYTETSRPRNYYPGTEKIQPDEMRVIALGTGTPHIRPSQASADWLVELGNGDTFIFDIGTGSTRGLSSLGIPYDQVNKVFLSHLHVDHVGDLDALWASG